MFSLSNMSQENVQQETSTQRDKCHFRIEFAYFVHDILCRYMFTMFTILVYCIQTFAHQHLTPTASVFVLSLVLQVFDQRSKYWTELNIHALNEKSGSPVLLQ